MFSAPITEGVDINVLAASFHTLKRSSYDGLKPVRATTTSHEHD